MDSLLHVIQGSDFKVFFLSLLSMAFINMEAVPLYFSCSINSRETIVNSVF